VFASLPKLADKNFVIGFLLPVLIAGFAGVLLFRDTQPIQAIYSIVLEEKTLSDLTVAVLGVWSAAVVLVLFNYQIYRLLEGYSGPLNQSAWIESHQNRYDDLAAYLTRMYPQIFPPPGTASAEVKREYFRRRLTFNTKFPYRRDLVLPTHFGNAIRSFESYPHKVYGVDSIPVWPRLQAVLPKEVTAAIDDSRAQVDFFINVLVMTLLIGGAALVRLGIYLHVVGYCSRGDVDAFAYCGPNGWGDVGFRWELIVWVGGAIIAARICYKAAIARVIVWGTFVKSAFDLYLPDLAKQLGYDVPATNAERQNFWDAVGSMFLYAAPVPDKWPRSKTGASAEKAGGAPLPPESDYDDTGDD
jgi:hypothetical protein